MYVFLLFFCRPSVFYAVASKNPRQVRKVRKMYIKKSMKQDFSPPLTLFFRQGTMTNVPVTRCIRGKKSVKLTKTKLLRPRLGGFFGFFEFFFFVLICQNSTLYVVPWSRKYCQPMEGNGKEGARTRETKSDMSRD